MEGRKEFRREGREEGRKEGRKEGMKENSKEEMRKERSRSINPVFLFSLMSNSPCRHSDLLPLSFQVLIIL